MDHLQLLGKANLPPTVQLPGKGLEELHVRPDLPKVPAAPQHQGLIHRLLEAMVGLLDVPVLIAAVGVGLLGFQVVMPQQLLIPPRELLEVAGVGHRRAEPIGPMPLWNPSQFPQSVLQTFAEALEALGVADRKGLPVGVAQHEVVDQVLKAPAADAHPQLCHVGKVRLAQPPGVMHLGEEHLPTRPLQTTPAFDLTLQRSQLTVGKLAGMRPLQRLQQRFGLQTGVQRQLLGHPWPNLLKWISPGPPLMLGPSALGS